MPVPCTCLLCDQMFIGKGRERPQQQVCPTCMKRYGNAVDGPVRSFIRQLTRARVAGVPATLTWQEWQQTCADFNNCCVYCEHRRTRVIEHYLPLDQHGGGTCVENCLLACQACNWRKGGKPPERTTFSPITMERLRRYLDWRRRGIQLKGEEISEEWQWMPPRGWRREGLWGGLDYYVAISMLERIMRPGPRHENLLIKVHQVEHLKAWVAQTPTHDPGYLLLHLRWAVSSDEAARLIIRAEEQLPEDLLLTLQTRSELNGQWETYRTSPFQLWALIEQYAMLPL